MNQEINSLMLLSEINNGNLNEEMKFSREVIIPDGIQDPFPFLTDIMETSGWAICYVDIDEENLLENESDASKLKQGQSSKAINITKLSNILEKSILEASKINNRNEFFLELTDEISQNLDIYDANTFNKISTTDEVLKLSNYVSFITSSSMDKINNGGMELTQIYKLKTDLNSRKNILACSIFLDHDVRDDFKIQVENIGIKKIINSENETHVGIFFDDMKKNFHLVVVRKLYQAYMLKTKIDHNKKAGFQAFINNQISLLNESLSGEKTPLDNENDTTDLSLLIRLFRGLEFNDIIEIYHHCLLLIADNFQILEIEESKGNNGDLNFDKSRYTSEETNIALMYRSYQSTYQPTSFYKVENSNENIRKFYITGRNTSTSNELNTLIGSAQSDDSSIINDAQLSYNMEAQNSGEGEQGVQAKIHQASIKLLQIINDELSSQDNEQKKNIDIIIDLFGFGTGATEARFFLNEIIRGSNGELCNVLACGENVHTNLKEHEDKFRQIMGFKHFTPYESYHNDVTSKHMNRFINEDNLNERKLFFNPQSQTSTNTIILSYTNDFTDSHENTLDNITTINITLNFLGIFDTVSSIKSETNHKHRWNSLGNGGFLPNTTKERFLYDGFNLTNSCGIPYEINIHPNSIERAVHITAGDEMRDNYRLNSLVSLNSFKQQFDHFSFMNRENNQEIFKFYDLYNHDNTMDEQDIASLIIHQAEPYALRQSEKLKLPQTFHNQNLQNTVYNLEEYTMRGEHEDIGGGHQAIIDETPKAGISFFKATIIQALKDKLNENNCLIIANQPENIELLESGMEELYQYINKACDFINRVATSNPKTEWYRNNKRKASRNLLRYTKRKKEYKIQYYEMIRNIFGLITFHFNVDEIIYYEDEINLAEKMLRIALDMKMDYNFNNLFSPYFGLYTENYRYKYQIENEFDSNSAFLSRNVMGELSNVYLKCMYQRTQNFNVPFDFNNLYYKHGVTAIKGILTENHDLFYVTNADEQQHTFNQLMNTGITTDIGWYDVANIMPLLLNRDCLATKQPLQDIREELKTQDTELLLVDGRVQKYIAYDETDNKFILTVSSGEPYGHNDNDDDQDEDNDVILSHSPSGIILIDEEVNAILKNSPLTINSIENNPKYQMNTSYYELMILLPKKHNDQYMETIKIDMKQLLKTNNIMNSVTTSQQKEYKYNEYNSSFAIDTTNNLNTIAESLPKIFSKDIHMEKDTDKQIYNVERLLKNLYIHHGENSQYVGTYFNNYTTITENQSISENILEKISNFQTDIIPYENISVRMVYYNDSNRAYFTRNLNTLKMNQNFYKARTITQAEYDKLPNPSLKETTIKTIIENGNNQSITIYLELTKQPPLTTEDILPLITQDPAQSPTPLLKPFDNTHDTNSK